MMKICLWNRIDLNDWTFSWAGSSLWLEYLRGFSFCFFPGFLAIFILLSSKQIDIQLWNSVYGANWFEQLNFFFAFRTQPVTWESACVCLFKMFIYCLFILFFVYLLCLLVYLFSYINLFIYFLFSRPSLWLGHLRLEGSRSPIIIQ